MEKVLKICIKGQENFLKEEVKPQLENGKRHSYNRAWCDEFGALYVR